MGIPQTPRTHTTRLGTLGALHRIPLIDNAIARSSYRWKTLQPTPEEQWLLENVDKWVGEGLIEEIKMTDAVHLTEASAPAKKDAQGNLTLRRLCVNYRQLNRITEKDTHEMPSAESCYRMRKARFFTKMDLQNGFWQTPLSENDRLKTAFRIKDRCFQWKLMPMGITNAPATFQKLIDRTLMA